MPPSALDPDVPPAIDAIVLHALAKDREQRYQTADEMRARHRPRARRAGRWRRSYRRCAAATQRCRTPTCCRTATIRRRWPTGAAPPAAGRPGRPRARPTPCSALAVDRDLRHRGADRTVAPRRLGRLATVAVPDVTGLTVDAGRPAEPDDRELALGTRRRRRATRRRGQRHRPEPRGRHPGRRGAAVSTSSCRPGVDEVAVPTLVGLSHGPGPAGARRTPASRSASTTSVDLGPAPQHRGQGQPARRARRSPAGSTVDLDVASGKNKVPDVRRARRGRGAAACSSRPASPVPDDPGRQRDADTAGRHGRCRSRPRSAARPARLDARPSRWSSPTRAADAERDADARRRRHR